MSEPVAVKVVTETPAERLQRLALVDPDVPPAELREAIAAAVTDVSDRLTALEEQRDEEHRANPIQPG